MNSTDDPRRVHRVSEGIRLIKQLQNDFAPIVPNENLPFFVAALITSGGPYNSVDLDLRALIGDLEAATNAVRDVLSVVGAEMDYDPAENT